MKRHYISLWLLLALAFAVFAIASAFELPAIGGYQPKTATFSDMVLAHRQSDMPVAGDDSLFCVPDSVVMEVMPTFPMPCDTSSQVILFIGDSMLEGLGPRLAAYAEHNGHTLYTVMWYSSTSEIWGKSDKLKYYIDKLNPTYIVVCLGSNELIVRDIEAKREKYVRKILSDIGSIPFLWIGPPNWREDTGINRLIEGLAPHGTFFVSNGMTFERSKDGAHPTRSSAAAWLDSVVRWMPDNALHPIRLDIPSQSSGRAKRIFVHQPDER